MFCYLYSNKWIVYIKEYKISTLVMVKVYLACQGLKSVAGKRIVYVGTWEKYGRNLDNNIVDLVSRLKRKNYNPIPARRVYIPKSETEKRPLGISALENKIVERGITWILESIYGEDFLDRSYGFHPKKNEHQALKKLNDLVMYGPVSHIVEADKKGFFDNLSHEDLLEFLKIKIRDTKMLNLINRFLKAGYIDNEILKPERRRGAYLVTFRQIFFSTMYWIHGLKQQ